MPVPIVQSDFPAPFSASPPDILAGTLTLYQLYDIGDAIDLDLAQLCLAEPTAQRRALPPTRQAESIQIAEPPLRVVIGATATTLADRPFVGTLRASIYDLGAVALALELPLPAPLGWDVIADLLAASQSLPAALVGRFTTALDDLEPLIHLAIARPARSPLIEDYSGASSGWIMQRIRQPWPRTRSSSPRCSASADD